MSVNQDAAKRRYNRWVWVAFIAYSGLLAGVITVLQTHPDAAWRYAVAPTPMIPWAFTVVAYVRYYRRMDELHQRMALEAFAFAFAGTALVTFTYGFLDFAGVPRINWWFVWPVMATLWIIGGFLARKRWL